MKPIIESNLNNKTGYERIDEIFGMETMGKLGSYFGNAINKSRQLNQLRHQNDMIERYRTRQANQQAMRRNWENARQNPQMYVNGDYSRGAAQMRGEFADRRIDNMGANRMNMDVDRAAAEDEQAAAGDIYDGYTATQVDRFNGHLPSQNKPPTGNNNPGGDNGTGNTGRKRQPSQKDQMLNAIINLLNGNGISVQVQNQIVNAIQNDASKNGGDAGVPPNQPPAGGATDAAQPQGADATAQPPPDENNGAPQNDAATPPQGSAPTSAGNPTQNKNVKKAPPQPGEPGYDIWKKRSDAARRGVQTRRANAASKTAPQQPTQPVTQSFERTIPNGLSAIIEDVLSKFN